MTRALVDVDEQRELLYRQARELTKGIQALQAERETCVATIWSLDAEAAQFKLAAGLPRSQLTRNESRAYTAWWEDANLFRGEGEQCPERAPQSKLQCRFVADHDAYMGHSAQDGQHSFVAWA